MASSLAAIAARRATSNLTRFSSSPIIQRRTFSAAADGHHGPERINIWEDPLSPSKWKEEQFVLVSIAGWVLCFYGIAKSLSGIKEKNLKKTDDKKVVESS